MNGVATPLLSVERGVRHGGSYATLCVYLWLLRSNRIKVIITKGVKVENKELKCVSFANDLTGFLHHKKSDVIQFLTTHICMMNAEDFSLTRTKKKPIGLLGSSHHNQEALDKTNVDDPIKILGILFICDRHEREELNFHLMLKSVKLVE